MSSEMNACQFAQLAKELHDAGSTGQTAQQVVEFACKQLDSDHAGITLIRRGGKLETIAPTDPLVEEADRLQYELGEGSCLESSWDSETLASDSLATDPRWPTWGPRVAALGLHSVLAVELTDTDRRRVGALNLFWSRERPVGRADMGFAHVFAQHAAMALSESMVRDNLHVALDTRKRIGIAQGILMERFGLTADQAFDVLRRYSQDYNRKLHDVADELIDTRLLPEE